MKEQSPHSAVTATDPLNIARDLILRPSGLDDGRLDRVFGEVMAHSVDFADLYFQLAHQESWSLEDALSRTAAPASSRVLVSVRSRVKRQASPTPMKLCCPLSKKRRARRAPSRFKAAIGA